MGFSVVVRRRLGFFLFRWSERVRARLVLPFTRPPTASLFIKQKKNKKFTEMLARARRPLDENSLFSEEPEGGWATSPHLHSALSLFSYPDGFSRWGSRWMRQKSPFSLRSAAVLLPYDKRLRSRLWARKRFSPFCHRITYFLLNRFRSIDRRHCQTSFLPQHEARLLKKLFILLK